MSVGQPFSWKAGLLFVLTGAGLVWYFENEKGRMQRKRIAESTKGVGRPKVGGPFELIDQNGNTVTDKDLKGRHSLVSAALVWYYYFHIDLAFARSTSASRTVPTFAPRNWTRWRGCSTWSRSSAPAR